MQSAISLLVTDHNRQAVSFLEKAIAADPDNVHAIFMDYAAALFEARQFEEALTVLRASLIVDPNQSAAHHNLGIASALVGREAEAIQAYEEAIRLEPGFMPAYLNLAGLYYQRKAYEQAQEWTEKSLLQNPGGDYAVEAYCNLYDVHQKLGHSPESCVKQLEKAMEACDGRPKAPLLYLNFANHYELTNDLQSLRKILDVALQRFPDCDQARYLLAICHRREKRFQDAIALLHQCDLRNFEPPELASVHFELGKCLHEERAYEKAFQHFTRANEISRSLRRPGPSGTLRRAKNHNQAIAADWDLKTDRTLQAAPVFLIGFPRSGTTLLEQILDSHPQVSTLDEKPVIRELVRRLVKIDSGNLMAGLDGLQNNEVQSLRDLYLQTRAGFAEGAEGQLIVDKLPLATINVPILYRLFPNAKFIFAVRHPLDCLLSCYMQNFALNDAMSNFCNLDDAADLYGNTMGIWLKSRECLPLKVHTARYEDVVDNVEKEARALLGFLGVPWDACVLNYHAHARDKGFINTPSYSQVTQPIYESAKYRWKNYAAELAASKAKLQPFIDYFGYR